MWPNGAMRSLTVQWYSQAGESSLASNVTTPSVCNVAHITGEPYLTGIPERRGLVAIHTRERSNVEPSEGTAEQNSVCVCVCV